MVTSGSADGPRQGAAKLEFGSKPEVWSGGYTSIDKLSVDAFMNEPVFRIR